MVFSKKMREIISNIVGWCRKQCGHKYLNLGSKASAAYLREDVCGKRLQRFVARGSDDPDRVITLHVRPICNLPLTILAFQKKNKGSHEKGRVALVASQR